MFRESHLIGRIRQRPVHGPGRRLLNWLRARLRHGVGKSQQAFFVTINGHRYKRVVFGDSLQASQVAGALEACRDCVGLPQLVLTQESEVWVRFVDGRQLDPGSPSDRQALADFFAALYAKDPGLVELAETSLHPHLLTDLGFLRDSGILDEVRYRTLRERAGELRPERLWLGYDYVDPVLKNFVINDQGLYAIDIESLQQGVALGSGIAKSGLHWLSDDRHAFLERVCAQPGVPDLAAQQAYVELCLIAGWTKRKLLTGKWSRARAEHFDRFCRIGAESGRDG